MSQILLSSNDVHSAICICLFAAKKHLELKPWVAKSTLMYNCKLEAFINSKSKDYSTFLQVYISSIELECWIQTDWQNKYHVSNWKVSLYTAWNWILEKRASLASFCVYMVTYLNKLLPIVLMIAFKLA